MVRCSIFIRLAAAAIAVWGSVGLAEPPPAVIKPATAGAAESLSVSEQQLADRFVRLEELLLRMAELTAPTDPNRAALLRKTVAQGKERLLDSQFDAIVKLLDKEQLSRAIENQTQLQRDLKAILDLLMTENRANRLESEKSRIGKYVKQIAELINEQKSLQARAAGADDPKRLGTEQNRLADRSADLSQKMKADESPAPKEPSEKPAASEKPSTEKPSEKPSAKKPANKLADLSAGDSEEAKPDAAPADRLREAERRMREAQKKLEQANRKGATKEQDEAIRELQQAKAALEKILRQLREEEMERTLTMLEVRFQKMIRLQRDVLEKTVSLDKTAESERTHEHEVEAGRLSEAEAQIVAEADRAVLLLREDGSAAAFAESLGQARVDMQQIVRRLAESKVGRMTQQLEEDVIAALEDMAAALKQAQKKLEDKKQGERPMMAGEPGEAPLVDLLSELKMIRTLQLRVNNRTEQYSKLIHGEQADDAELQDALRRLAERQKRIVEIAHDLDLGKAE